MIKEEQNKTNLLIQIICDSKGCREVDLFDTVDNNTVLDYQSNHD